jgi:hypothetical protein
VACEGGSAGRSREPRKWAVAAIIDDVDDELIIGSGLTKLVLRCAARRPDGVAEVVDVQLRASGLRCGRRVVVTVRVEPVDRADSWTVSATVEIDPGEDLSACARSVRELVGVATTR